MAIPLVVVLVQLEGWFGYRPLKPGESTIVSLKTSEGREEEMAKGGARSGEGTYG